MLQDVHAFGTRSRIQRAAPLQEGEAKRGPARLPGNPDVLPGLGARATQCCPLWRLAKYGDAEIHWSSRRVAADQFDPVGIRAIEKAARKRRNPILVCRWYCHGEQRPFGHRTHCCEVRQIDRQCFPAKVSWISVMEKMGTCHQHVGGRHQFVSRTRLNYGAIVPDAKYGTGSGTAKISIDEIELGSHVDHRFWLATRRGLFRPQLRRQLVEHAIDELVAIRTAEGLGKLDRFIDDDTIGGVDAIPELTRG